MPEIDVDLIDQRLYALSLPIPPNITAWKLYPPRLRLDSHEIVIDNDLIVYQRIPLVDEFLAGNFLIITEAYKRSYGVFDAQVPPHTMINTGFYGMPPGFDLAKHLSEGCVGLTGWHGHFDEQGLMASIFSRYECKIISLDDVFVAYDWFKMGRCGVHFVGLNNGAKEFWSEYIRRTLI